MGKLTDAFIRKLKPTESVKRYADGLGLTLVSYPHGTLGWRCRYYFGGKEKALSFGSYPEVTLKEAREKLADLRKTLRDGNDPSAVRKAEKQEQTNDFKSVALRWHKAWSVGKDQKHAEMVLRRLEQNVFPELGTMSINSITAPMLIKMAQKIVERGAYDVASRSFNTAGQVFRYAIVEGICDRNPAKDVTLGDAHIQAPAVKHRTALAPKDVPALMKAIDTYCETYNGSIITQLAIVLMAHTFVRTSELIEARWDEVDFKEKVWIIPANRMKKVQTRPSAPHVVALSKQTIKVLKQLHEITGGREYIFPHESNPRKCMSNNTILFALYRMGYKGRMTGHGFRGVASTILHEQGYPHAHIEAQLSHIERDKVSGAYNHAQYLDQRRKMLQDWSNYLDNIKAKGMITKPRGKKA